MTIDEIEKEIELLQAEVGAIGDRQGQVERNQQRFEDASKILIELARKAQRRAAEHQERIASLVEIAETHDGRLDTLEESQVHADARLDALIDSQIQVNQRLDELGVYVREVTTRTGESMTQLEAFIAETARQVRVLVEGREGNGSKPTQ